jgi:hypothetical protein
MTTRERAALLFGIILDLAGLLVYLNYREPEATQAALNPPAIIEQAQAAGIDRILDIPALR